jgi:hypothetical protein|uniref:Uncharacterized protein n=1 Tax=Zea mays TaxID=4577 RepID=A0A804PFW7_MAIZE
MEGERKEKWKGWQSRINRLDLDPPKTRHDRLQNCLHLARIFIPCCKSQQVLSLGGSGGRRLLLLMLVVLLVAVERGDVDGGPVVDVPLAAVVVAGPHPPDPPLVAIAGRVLAHGREATAHRALRVRFSSSLLARVLLAGTHLVRDSGRS